MQLSHETSDLLYYRADDLVRKRWDKLPLLSVCYFVLEMSICFFRLQKIRKAILDRRFAEFAELTMRDSNQLHACCMDTYPPLTYLNDTSHSVISLVHHINEQRMNPIVSALTLSSASLRLKQVFLQVAYTFDAGPNAFLFVQKENLSMVCDYLRHCFNNPATPDFFKGLDFDPNGGTINKARASATLSTHECL